MNENYNKALSEVSEILSLVSNDMQRSIPKKFINLIEKEKDKNYIPKFDKNKPLEEQTLFEETISILAIIKLNYWCNEDEKKEFMNMLNENERKYQENINTKYNIENLFTRETKIKEMKVENSEKFAMIEYKENVVINLINKIRKNILSLWKNK